MKPVEFKSDSQDKRLIVSRWAFGKRFKLGVADLVEIDLLYEEPLKNNILRFPTNTEPLTPNYGRGEDPSEKVQIEQDIFWAAHFRYAMNGEFYQIAKAGIHTLQSNKFQLYNLSGEAR